MPFPEGFLAAEGASSGELFAAIRAMDAIAAPRPDNRFTVDQLEITMTDDSTGIPNGIAVGYQASAIGSIGGTNIGNLVVSNAAAQRFSLSDFNARVHLPSDSVWDALIEALKNPAQLEALRKLLNVAKPLPEPTEPNRRVIDL